MTAATCVVAAAAFPMPVTSQASERTAVTLERTNHFRGPGELRVTLPRDIRFDMSRRKLFGPGGIEIAGGGRIAGVVLQTDPISRAQPVFAALRVTDCPSARCASSLRGAASKGIFPFYGPVKIPAGTYRLFLVGESDVDVTWTIDELRGTTDAAAPDPLALDLATPHSTLRNGTGATFYEASATYEFTSSLGMAFSATWVRSEAADRGARITYCFSDEDGILPADARTAGACLPTGTGSIGSFNNGVLGGGPRSFALFTWVFMTPYDVSFLPGDGSEWTYAFFANAPGNVVSAGSQAMILSY